MRTSAGAVMLQFYFDPWSFLEPAARLGALLLATMFAMVEEYREQWL